MLSDAAEVGVAHYVKTQKPAVDVMETTRSIPQFSMRFYKKIKKRSLISRTRNGETKRTKISFTSRTFNAEKTDKLNKIINS